MKKILLTAIAVSLLMLGGCKKNDVPAETPNPTATPVVTAAPTEAPAVLIQAENASGRCPSARFVL